MVGLGTRAAGHHGGQPLEQQALIAAAPAQLVADGASGASLGIGQVEDAVGFRLEADGLVEDVVNDELALCAGAGGVDAEARDPRAPRGVDVALRVHRHHVGRRAGVAHALGAAAHIRVQDLADSVRENSVSCK